MHFDLNSLLSVQICTIFLQLFAIYVCKIHDRSRYIRMYMGLNCLCAVNKPIIKLKNCAKDITITDESGTVLDIKRVENAFFSLNVHFLSHTSCY